MIQEILETLTFFPKYLNQRRDQSARFIIPDLRIEIDFRTP